MGRLPGFAGAQKPLKIPRVLTRMIENLASVQSGAESETRQNLSNVKIQMKEVGLYGEHSEHSAVHHLSKKENSNVLVRTAEAKT